VTGIPKLSEEREVITDKKWGGEKVFFSSSTQQI